MGEFLRPSPLPFPTFNSYLVRRQGLFLETSLSPPGLPSRPTQASHPVVINNLILKSTFYGTLGQANSKLAQLKRVIRHNAAIPINSWTSANVLHYFRSWASGKRNHYPEIMCRRSGVENRVVVAFFPSDFTLKFWVDKWKVRKDLLWGRTGYGVGEEVLRDLSLRSLSLSSPRNAGKSLSGSHLASRWSREDGRAFPENTKSGLTSSCHICRARLSGQRLGVPGPSHTEYLDDLEQVMFSFFGLFL